MLRKQQNILN